jgi:signal peptidase I
MDNNELSKENRRSTLKRYAKYLVLDVLIAALVSILLITYVASAYKIEGNSMQTALNDQERIIISKLAARGDNFSRFDIVVLRKPDEPGKSIIKRVIGLPGEIIEIKNGDVYIDDRKLPEPYLKKKKNLMFRTISMKPLLIREGYYFVIGDNRAVSYDSRVFGPVPGSSIYGKMILRYWPLSRFGSVE